MKNNQIIRQAILDADIKYWEVANEYGITDGNFSRKLRKELSNEETKKILDIISKLKKEAIEIYGTNVYYIQRNSVDYNNILGEDLGQEFKDATLLVMYPETVENFGGNQEFMAKFGFTLQDTTNFLLHKDEFKLVEYLD